MIMPGRNEIHYCAAALTRIIEKSINEQALVGNVRVTSITTKHDGGSTTYVVEVTTDPEPAP